jgi:hypothetical protein
MMKTMMTRRRRQMIKASLWLLYEAYGDLVRRRRQFSLHKNCLSVRTRLFFGFLLLSGRVFWAIFCFHSTAHSSVRGVYGTQTIGLYFYAVSGASSLFSGEAKRALIEINTLLNYRTLSILM